MRSVLTNQPAVLRYAFPSPAKLFELLCGVLPQRVALLYPIEIARKQRAQDVQASRIGHQLDDFSRAYFFSGLNSHNQHGIIAK